MSQVDFKATVTQEVGTVTFEGMGGSVVNVTGGLVQVTLESPDVIFINYNGERGEEGPAGASVVGGTVNVSGELIIELSTGAFVNVGSVIGPPGPQGDEGDQGDEGPEGRHVVSGVVLPNNHLVITMSDGSEIDVGYVVGPPGPKGDEGDQGDEGPEGRHVVLANVVDGELILTLSDSSNINAGDVTGPPGPTGDDGSNGVSVTNVYVNEFDRLIVTLSNSTVIDAGSVVPIDNGYTQGQTDALLADKANVVDVYNKTEVDDLLEGFSSGGYDNRNATYTLSPSDKTFQIFRYAPESDLEEDATTPTALIPETGFNEGDYFTFVNPIYPPTESPVMTSDWIIRFDSSVSLGGILQVPPGSVTRIRFSNGIWQVEEYSRLFFTLVEDVISQLEGYGLFLTVDSFNSEIFNYYTKTEIDDRFVYELSSYYDQGQTNAQIDLKIANLINSAPGALDTLDELAAALGDDPNFATTITNALAQKQPLDANLTSIASKTYAANQMIYWTADDVVATFNTTSFGRGLLNLADAAALRTAAALGTMATAATTNYYTKTEVDGLVGSGVTLTQVRTEVKNSTAYEKRSTAATITAGTSKPFQLLEYGTTERILNISNTGAVAGDWFQISYIYDQAHSPNDHYPWTISVNGVTTLILTALSVVRFRFDGTTWIPEMYAPSLMEISNTFATQFLSSNDPQFNGGFTEELNIQSISGAFTLDPNNGSLQRLTMSGNVTLTMPANPDVTRSTTCTIILGQDATGGRTLAWPSSVKWDGGIAPTLTGAANKYDVICLTWSGFYWLASFQNKNVDA